MLKFSLSATTEKIQKNVRFQCVPNSQILLYNTKMTLCLWSNIEAGKQTVCIVQVIYGCTKEKNSIHGKENYVFFILALFSQKLTKPDRERVKMDEGIFEITISKRTIYVLYRHYIMVKNVHYYTY